MTSLRKFRMTSLRGGQDHVSTGSGEVLLDDRGDEVVQDGAEEDGAGQGVVGERVAEGLLHGGGVGRLKACRVETKRRHVEAFEPRGRHERPPLGSRPRARAERTAAWSRSASAARAVRPSAVRR